MNLYSKYAKEFSNTRQSAWKGWSILNKKINLSKVEKLKILDLGCGNGRFLKFIKNELGFINVKYTGIDNSVELLEMARQTFQKSSSNLIFFKDDLENITWVNQFNTKFNLITGFGLMHHLKTFISRQNLLKQAAQLLDKEGYLVLTFWQFAILERYKKMMMNPSKLEINFKLNTNDFLLSFGQNGAYRFCHYCDEKELLDLVKNTNLKEVDRYYADGKEENQNLYIVYQLI